jgi:hypothetical protein
VARRSLISRSSWTPIPSPWPPMPGRARRIFVHHTVMALKGGARASRAVEAGYWRGVRAVALARGFRDVSYNVGIAPSGRSWILAGWRIAAHTCNHNGDSFGFVAAGNFQGVDRVTRAMTRAYGRAIQMAKRRGKVARDAQIGGHRDVGACTGPTACPGDRLYARLPEIRRLAKA